ncbi:MAG: hypothetical protein FWH26_01700 [Oscillospiraceae bacterium]|nr:hypothetical protein [Oscillospiraceae bacterium]
MDTQQIVKTITLPEPAISIAANPETGQLYVTAENTLYVIDSATGEYQTVSELGMYFGKIIYDPGIDRIYLAAFYSGFPYRQVMFVDANSLNHVDSVQLFYEDKFEADIDLGKLYVINAGGGIDVFNGANGERFDSLDNLAGSALQITVDSPHHRLYVITDNGNVHVFDTTNDEELFDFLSEPNAQFFEVNSALNQLYVLVPNVYDGYQFYAYNTLDGSLILEESFPMLTSFSVNQETGNIMMYDEDAGTIVTLQVHADGTYDTLGSLNADIATDFAFLDGENCGGSVGPTGPTGATAPKIIAKSLKPVAKEFCAMQARV